MFSILTSMEELLALFTNLDELSTSVSEILLALCLRVGNSVSSNTPCFRPTQDVLGNIPYTIKEILKSQRDTLK